MPSIVQSNRTLPWIGIGVSGQWESSAEALSASQLDFTVRQKDLYWLREDKNDPQLVWNEKVPMFANVRETDDKTLGCVTPQYKIIQNAIAFSILDPFLGGNNVITHAGMTVDGLCFMVAELEVRMFGQEPYVMYLMATNSFNTKYPCQIIMTPVRIICQNMYRKLVSDRIFLAKHTTTAHNRLIATANSNTLEKKIMLFKDVVEQSQDKVMDSKQLALLVSMLFPYPKEGGPREQTFKLKADEARQEFLDVYYAAADNTKWHGTAFGFINAYYDYLSHRNPSRGSGANWVDRRLQGLVDGVDVNNSVLHQALR